MNRFNRTLLSASLCLILATPAAANLQGTMDHIFNAMANTSKPGVYEGIRRGVIAGGEVTVKNRIMDANLLSITAPDWRAGCGGIDIYGGSFSYINSDQIVQLMRSIAANATGYAFKLAIDAISQSIGMNISDWLQKAQDMINKLGNSCELAKTAVDWGVETAVSLYDKKVAEGAVRKEGIVADDAEATQSDAVGQGKDTTDVKAMIGNLVYRSLLEQGADNWFVGGDTELIRQIMSVTGTVVVSVGEKREGRTDFKYMPFPATLTIEDLVEGGNELTVWKCTTLGGADHPEKACLTMEKERVTLTSLSDRITQVLIGNYRVSNQVGGIVQKYHSGEGVPTDEEMNVIASTGTAGVMIRNLAVKNATLAADFVRTHIKTLTVEYLDGIVRDMVSAASLALTQSKSAHTGEALKMLQDNAEKAGKEVERLYTKYGAPNGLYADYLNALKVLPQSDSDAVVPTDPVASERR